MRWVLATVCIAGLTVVGLWLVSERMVLRDDFGGEGTSLVESPGSDEAARELAHEECAGRTVGELARMLETPDSKELVASAVAVKSGNPPVAYTTCMTLLRE